MAPSTASSRTSESPIGLGLYGERVANRPAFAPRSRGGCTFGLLAACSFM